MGGFLQDYTFVFKHKTRVENKVADAQPTSNNFGNYERKSDRVREIEKEI